MKNAKNLGIVLALLLGLYIGSYLAFSVAGRYEPAAIGLNGVKAYGWAPYGFVSEYRRRWNVIIFYAPLYYLDNRFWHTYEKSYSGQYPVNVVERKDIWKVYQAWD